MKFIEERLGKIEDRNTRVEMDKAWEVSWTRRLSVTVITYIVVALVLSRLHSETALFDALIPCCGYLLSTLSLPPIKRFWLQQQASNTESVESGSQDNDSADI